MWRRKNDVSGEGESSGTQDTCRRQGGGTTQLPYHQQQQQQQQSGGGGYPQQQQPPQQHSGSGGGGGGGYHHGGARGCALQQQGGGTTQRPYQQQQSGGGGRSAGGGSHRGGQRGWVRQQQGGVRWYTGGRGSHRGPPQQHQPRGPQYHQRGSGGRGVFLLSRPLVPATEPTPTDITQPFQHLSLQQEPYSSGSANQPNPASTNSHEFPLRPGTGRIGTRCLVKANHFLAKLTQVRDLHQYDVSITPEATSRRVNRAIMSQLVEIYKESHLGNRLPAYDGRNSLYTAGHLPFISKDFRITLPDENNESAKEREFEVVIKLASRANLSNLKMLLDGKQADEPRGVIQVLDIVLRQVPSSLYCPLGRSFYSPLRKQPLGEGLESWRGFYQSLRPTQMGLSLNIDISSTAFIEPLPVIEFVMQLLNTDITNRILSEVDCKKITKALKGVKIKVTHRGRVQRRYRVFSLTSQATRDLMFDVHGKGTMISLVEYFRETYQFVIQHAHLPCLQVNNPKKPIYLPMEVCQIVDGQRHTKRLSERQITSLLRATCQRPKERESEIVQTAWHNDYANHPHAKEFGIRICEDLATVEARILPPPRLKYHETGQEKECLPQVGQWNMVNKKMVNGGIVENWICINFAQNVQDRAALGFCNELSQTCNISGMQFNPKPVLPQIRARPQQVERELKSYYIEAMTELQKKDLDLLFAILPDNNGSLYGDIKRISETELGIVSQCCLAKNVFRISKQFLANLALKINVKVGGRNTVLVDALSRRIPFVSDRPTIIFGADVTHPKPGDDSSSSIAAVVASQDWPEITNYAGLVSAQPHHQELIDDLFKIYEDGTRGTITGGMIKEHLISFRRETGQKPQRIIFYRDGVSQGQFSQVLIHEIDAIRKACDSLEPDYQPPITFIVVQKGHHTRLFPNCHGDPKSVDKSGNILPGTVVDTKICHPREFDFYLCSHAGIQGTSRPAHYHVLWDENKFTADALQSLTYNLCYSFARCTRSVSIVPPVYYAHLAAFRARFYMERESPEHGAAAADNVGMRVGARSTRVQGTDAAVRPLPAIKGNVKRVMFYC